MQTFKLSIKDSEINSHVELFMCTESCILIQSLEYCNTPLNTENMHIQQRLTVTLFLLFLMLFLLFKHVCVTFWNNQQYKTKLLVHFSHTTRKSGQLNCIGDAPISNINISLMQNIRNTFITGKKLRVAARLDHLIIIILHIHLYPMSQKGLMTYIQYMRYTRNQILCFGPHVYLASLKWNLKLVYHK